MELKLNGKINLGDDKPSAPQTSIVVHSEDSVRLTVERINNHIYFYSDVDSDRCLSLIRNLRDLDAELRGERISRFIESLPPTPIWLHINSNGGNAFDAFAVGDQIAKLQTPVFSIVEGLCASAATLVAMACKRRFMQPSAFVLIHQFRTLKWGTYSELQDQTKLHDMLWEQLKAFYTSHSRISAEEIEEILRHDSWYNASQCLENGIVDEVL